MYAASMEVGASPGRLGRLIAPVSVSERAAQTASSSLCLTDTNGAFQPEGIFGIFFIILLVFGTSFDTDLACMARLISARLVLCSCCAVKHATRKPQAPSNACIKNMHGGNTHLVHAAGLWLQRLSGDVLSSDKVPTHQDVLQPLRRLLRVRAALWTLMHALC